MMPKPMQTRWPVLLDDGELGTVGGWWPLRGVGDVDDGCGADFETEGAGLHVDEDAVGDFVESEGRVFGNPLGGGGGGGEQSEEEDA